MVPDHLVDFSGRPGPNDVDDPVHPPAIQERYSDSGEPVGTMAPIGAPDDDWSRMP
jgi:hypothetical protein